MSAQERANRLIAYYRVSTDKQGIRGLGIEAQEAAVAAYVRSSAGAIVESYREVESGKNADRPQLRLAIAHARSIGGKLIIAKLDRLSRNLKFIVDMIEGDVDFVACDMPAANRAMLQIMAVMAEQEARAISERTKAGLDALRARGMVSATPGPNFGKIVTLGNRGEYLKAKPERVLEGSARAVAVRKTKAAKFYEHIAPIIRDLRGQGMGFHAIAKRLNELEHWTRGGCEWGAAQVRRVFLMEASPAERPLPFRRVA